MCLVDGDEKRSGCLPCVRLDVGQDLEDWHRERGTKREFHGRDHLHLHLPSQSRADPHLRRPRRGGGVEGKGIERIVQLGAPDGRLTLDTDGCEAAKEGDDQDRTQRSVSSPFHLTLVVRQQRRNDELKGLVMRFIHDQSDWIDDETHS